MRRVENPASPFAQVACEWEEEPPLAGLEVREEQARAILAHNDSPDIPFSWSLNPYRGCQHACSYCYARRTHEYLDLGTGTDFETKITAKVNAPELLARELSRPGWRQAYIAFSGVTDCYQPLEIRYQLTRRCLEVCRDIANPIGIVTKAYLVVRDAELLADLNRRREARVLFSVTFADDAAARVIEPGAPPPSRRFEAMRRLHEAGVPVGIMIAPVIPGLNDREIPALLARAAECGAETAGYAPVRLPGSVAEVFLTRLRAKLPDTASRIEARIREMRNGKLNLPEFGARMEGVGNYWESVERLFETAATRVGLNPRANWCELQRECGTRRNAGAWAKAASPKQLPLFEIRGSQAWLGDEAPVRH